MAAGGVKDGSGNSGSHVIGLDIEHNGLLVAGVASKAVGDSGAATIVLEPAVAVGNICQGEGAIDSPLGII